jgi:hypothetical protein
LKRKEHESQKFGKGLSFVSREKKWQKIVEYLIALPSFEGVDIDVPRCIDKWDNVQAVYKKFNQYINQESGTGNLWLLSREERKKANLPQYFTQEMYDKMSLWYGTSGRFSWNVPIVDSMKKPDDVKLQESPRKSTSTFPNAEAASFDSPARPRNLGKVRKYVLLSFLGPAMYLCTM